MIKSHILYITQKRDNVEFLIIKYNNDFVLGCSAIYDRGDEKEKLGIQNEVNEMLLYLRSFDGVYLNGFFDDNYDKSKNLTIIENGLSVKNSSIIEIFEEIFKSKLTFNKLSMEYIMARKQAPYKLWTITALKNECKQRKLDVSEIEDSKDKSLFIALIQSDDEIPNSAKEELDDELEEELDDELEEELDDELEEELDDELEDELDDELEGTPLKLAPKKVASKKVAPKKVASKKVASKKGISKKGISKKGTSKKEASKKEAPKKEAPKKVTPKKEAPKKEAPKKVTPKKVTNKMKKENTAIYINEQLRKKKLWRSGCQFLSKADKLKLLDAKSTQAKNKIYKMLDEKFNKVKKQISVSTLALNKKKKADKK